MEATAIERVIEISADAKYVFVLPENTTMAEADRLIQILREWQQSNSQFLVIRGGVELRRIDE